MRVHFSQLTISQGQSIKISKDSTATHGEHTHKHNRLGASESQRKFVMCIALITKLMLPVDRPAPFFGTAHRSLAAASTMPDLYLVGKKRSY